ncbi:MAG TPA: hypothetical protein VIC26_14480 [Marinagarivorans sp.]
MSRVSEAIGELKMAFGVMAWRQIQRLLGFLVVFIWFFLPQIDVFIAVVDNAAGATLGRDENNDRQAIS